ncbi:flagellar basal body-associated protein FliL [Oceanobacillus profundus]|uniref:flagellar basal body-associated protein FliL n=1 Tax=Oceanobacillus TaxID=182709 RepID=UPI0026E39B99|nr:flagellar basal body-associated protein FliL [Oceanobacillus profundus]MDO6449630.1 flagellar basal body-associated protein FliL [Oceanobacillus profundus]
MSKLVKTMITSLVVLLVIAIASLVVVLNVAGENKKGDAQSIDDIVNYSYESPEITTDLADGAFVRIQFQIVTDGKETLKEVEKRDFQLKNIIIKELATKTEEDFKSGLSELEQVVKSSLNELVEEGEITEVYTINKILQ